MIGANSMVIQHNVQQISEGDPCLGAMIAFVCCIIIIGLLIKMFSDEDYDY